MKIAVQSANRVVFLDYLRVIAVFMVVLVHACEQFYFGADGGFFIRSLSDASWVVGIDSACRAAVPLFVMTSAYLLFPVKRPTGEFLLRRIVRVMVPFAVWCCVYNWWNGGSWGQMLFNFPMATGGHLWFVPMLVGLYLAMPLLSPWAERASEKEVRGWILLWFFTTTFPFLRKLWGILYGTPDFGSVPFLYGECPWNSFGMFHYVSGFFGYLLLGFYMRRFLPKLDWKQTLSAAVPLAVIGWLIVSRFFFCRISNYGVEYPVSAPYAAAVDLEMSWEFCSTGVAMTVVAYFLVVRKLTTKGVFYAKVVRPLAEASFGVYLVHIIVLCPVTTMLRPQLPTSVTIAASALLTFLVSSLICVVGRKIPRVGTFIFG
jgi:surface polysaccharide O-acyltransferase-like enzyme